MGLGDMAGEVQMKILAVLYMLQCPVCEPTLVATYFTPDGPAICQATAVAQTATEHKEYYCE